MALALSVGHTIFFRVGLDEEGVNPDTPECITKKSLYDVSARVSLFVLIAIATVPIPVAVSGYQIYNQVPPRSCVSRTEISAYWRATEHPSGIFSSDYPFSVKYCSDAVWSYR